MQKQFSSFPFFKEWNELRSCYILVIFSGIQQVFKQVLLEETNKNNCCLIRGENFPWWGWTWVYLNLLSVCFFSRPRCFPKEDYIINSQQGKRAQQHNPNMKINPFPQPKSFASQTQVNGSTVMLPPKHLDWATTAAPLGHTALSPNEKYMG